MPLREQPPLRPRGCLSRPLRPRPSRRAVRRAAAPTSHCGPAPQPHLRRPGTRPRLRLPRARRRRPLAHPRLRGRRRPARIRRRPRHPRRAAARPRRAAGRTGRPGARRPAGRRGDRLHRPHRRRQDRPRPSGGAAAPEDPAAHPQRHRRDHRLSPRRRRPRHHPGRRRLRPRPVRVRRPRRTGGRPPPRPRSRLRQRRAGPARRPAPPRGILALHGRPRRFVLQGVHELFELRAGAAWGAEPPSTRAVFIGRDLDAEEPARGLRGCAAGPRQAGGVPVR